MFRNTFVSGFVSLFFSLGSKPLELWHVVKGEGASVGLVRDEELDSAVLELRDANVSTTRIECPPASRDTLGIGLNFLVLLVKNMDAFSPSRLKWPTTRARRGAFAAPTFRVTRASGPK